MTPTERRDSGRNHAARGANGNYADENCASPAGNCTHARGHPLVREPRQSGAAKAKSTLCNII